MNKEKRDAYINRYYNKTDKQKESSINYQKRKIQNGTDPIIKQMMAITEQHVKYYDSDFYIHDYTYRQMYNGHFLWIVRDSGTHFIPLALRDFLPEAKTWVPEESFKAIIRSTRIKYICLYDGNSELKKLSLNQAKEIITKYANKIYSETGILL